MVILLGLRGKEIRVPGVRVGGESGLIQDARGTRKLDRGDCWAIAEKEIRLGLQMM